MASVSTSTNVKRKPITVTKTPIAPILLVVLPVNVNLDFLVMELTARTLITAKMLTAELVANVSRKTTPLYASAILVSNSRTENVSTSTNVNVIFITATPMLIAATPAVASHVLASLVSLVMVSTVTTSITAKTLTAELAVDVSKKITPQFANAILVSNLKTENAKMLTNVPEELMNVTLVQHVPTL